MNELSQLDELIESDILDALGEEQIHLDNENEEEILIEDVEDEILIEDVDESDESEELVKQEIEQEDNTDVQSIESVAEKSQKIVSEVNTNDLASLLSQLLNNKTIEITIKIKD